MASFVSQFVIPSNDGYRVWEDPSFIKWRKRDAHVSLHCHDTVEGSLKYWYERNKVDLLVSNSAVWDDDAVSGALDCAAFWVKGLPFVKSLSGYWKFLLAPRPSDVPLNFYDSEFQDSVWETLPVPSNWQMHGFDLPVYISAGYAFPIDPPNIPADNPTGCYRTYFHLPKEWEGRRIFLHFEAVDSALHAWINGFSVGYRPVRTVDYLLSLKSLISVIHVDQTRKTFWLFKYINGAMVLTLKIKITGGYLAFIVMCFFWPSQRYSLQTIPSNQTWGKTFPMQIYRLK